MSTESTRHEESSASADARAGLIGTALERYDFVIRRARALPLAQVRSRAARR